MNDNQILVIVLFVSMMIGTGLICGIGVLIHIRKRKKKDEKQFIAESERHKPNCKHDEYLKELSGELDKMSLTFIERHYIYTTAFSYLHHDKDHCDCNE